MEVQFDILTLIGILGAAQALVVGAALLTIQERRTRVFGLLLVSLGTVMGVILYSHMHPGREPLMAVLFETAISLIAPVLFFWFVVLVVKPEWRRWIIWCAAIPATWVLYAAIAGLVRGPSNIWIPPIEMTVALHVMYTLISALLVVGSRADGKRVSAGHLRWARLTVFFMALINCSQGVRLLVDSEHFRNVVPLMSGFVVIALTFVAARQSRVFLPLIGVLGGDGSAVPTGAHDADGEAIEKYRSSSLTEEESERGFARFRRAMEVERVFLREDLSLDGLAEELGLARTYLSQVINEHCEKSFLEVVADYRVQEAQRLLTEDEAGRFTAEAIGSRAGFQSKSAFYAAFRKRTGVAPAEYRRRLRRMPGGPGPPIQN